ncbi:transferase hexapeptide (six repeat-containing protein) [Treponema bryantii]|uniref:Transferase hexapeptide (Six repeat-containing protein) n=1 Tax=Treponema bryantii TaxID=163 RepID=A0A1H9G393_9SPIR|nr:acyltransferase [Treponema bryantii]SEQ44551.1 transferase hexapeptide (six repeat-containing protein) [Treponema bryantii]
MKKIFRIINILFYYSIAQFLPDNYFPGIGKISKFIRTRCARSFCKKIDKSAQIQKRVYLGNGSKIEIGCHSSLGAYSKVQNTKLKVGNDVMVGEYLSILGGGHISNRTDIPMRLQGKVPDTELLIEDDVWIGAHCIILPGCKKISKGSIIGAGSVVTHDVDEYSVFAGNPAKKIKSRL